MVEISFLAFDRSGPTSSSGAVFLLLSEWFLRSGVLSDGRFRWTTGVNLSYWQIQTSSTMGTMPAALADVLDGLFFCNSSFWMPTN